jgi:hypothetical protein
MRNEKPSIENRVVPNWRMERQNIRDKDSSPFAVFLTRLKVD